MNWPEDKVRLYAIHRAALIEYAVPIVGDRTRAEDIVQEAFIRYTPAAAGNDIRNPLGYLCRIVRNLAYDLGRRRAAEHRVLKDDRSWWREPTETATPEKTLSDRQQLREVQAALSSLPPQVRQALNMHRGGGHTFQEIADALGVSVNTAFRWVNEGVAHVATHLASSDD